MFTHNLLFVDDEANILKSLSRLFRGERYRIFTAASGKEGLEIIQKDTISLVVSDQKMPGMSGVEFLNEVKKLFPDTMRIMLTGYADVNATMEAINRGEIYRFATKPWNDLEIKIIVNQALRQYELVRNNEKLSKLNRIQNIELRELNTNLEKKVEERTRIISQKKNELEKIFFDSIRVFVGILELYNPFLGNHSKRTALLARMMATNEGFKKKDIESVEVAAMLHDIGMIGIPKEISDAKLNTLQGDKRKIYEQHPVIGQAAIKRIKKLEPIGMLIRSHHERFDGKGYPDGLKEEQIPISARIIAVADFYDEIHTFGLSDIDKSDTNTIKLAIKENSGKMFDPRMVKHLFTALESLKGKTAKEILVPLEDLAEGMVVSRDIYTDTGLFLVTTGTILNEIYINKIKNYGKIGQIGDKVYIYV